MHLFIQPFTVRHGKVELTDRDCIKQLKTVLRVRIGESIAIQSPTPTNNLYTRHTISIEQLTNDIVVGKIAHTQEHTAIASPLHMYIAMPNKPAKAELIVQKLSEIGIQHIHFWPAERSVIKTENSNKMQRLHMIAREATEQSWWWVVPTVMMGTYGRTANTYGRINDASLQQICFDMQQHDTKIPHMNTDTLSDYMKEKKQTTDHVIAIVGPEGWLTKKDYESLLTAGELVTCELGDTVLRMETAAIVGGWRLKRLL